MTTPELGDELSVSIRDLGKVFRIHRAWLPGISIKDDIARLLTLRWLWSDQQQQEFHALDGINLDVRPGEIVGFLGGNGAGKSTLLKILCRITAPDRGWAALRGRVAQILEVGTGFHPDLSGRENIYLNAALLGMRRQEINRRFNDIVAFADIGPYLDEPVRHYSSGMFVRLAFAIAAHLDPEILIIDEVLAVGDEQFRAKCLSHVRQHFAGRTVLFVSHDMEAIRSICTRTVVLDRGHIIFDGPVEQGIACYREGQSPLG